MTPFADPIASDDIDVVRAWARELAKDLSMAKARISEYEWGMTQRDETVKEVRASRATEHARATEHIELLRKQVVTNEQDICALQHLLATICDVGGDWLPKMLEWVFRRMKPDEIMSVLEMREKVTLLLGMCQTFRREVRIE